MKNMIGLLFGFLAGIFLMIAGKLMDDKTASAFYDGIKKSFK